MTTLLYTNDRFGYIEFNLDDLYIDDTLNRDAIWDASGHDYNRQRSMYMEIAGELFEDHPDYDELTFEERDFGVRVLLPDTDEWFYLEAGSHIHVA